MALAMNFDYKKAIAAINLPVVAAHYRLTGIQRTGKKFEACCPFHKEDDSKCLSISFNQKHRMWRFFCSFCEVYGDGLAFIALWRGITNKKAATELKAGKLKLDNRSTYSLKELMSSHYATKTNQDKGTKTKEPVPLKPADVEASMARNLANPLCLWFAEKTGHAPEYMAELFTSNRVDLDQEGYTLFYQSDRQGWVWNCQAMLFDKHTGEETSIRRQCASTGLIVEARSFYSYSGQPFHLFGSHQLEESDWPVCITKEAKDALFGALFVSGLVWVSTCGSNLAGLDDLKGLDPERPIRILLDRSEAPQPYFNEVLKALLEMGFTDVKRLFPIPNLIPFIRPIFSNYRSNLPLTFG